LINLYNVEDIKGVIGSHKSKKKKKKKKKKEHFNVQKKNMTTR
jgi:hypothetical protein